MNKKFFNMLGMETYCCCYVCQEDETIESPFCKTNICNCKGSNRIHTHCFQKLRNQSVCSVCKNEFKNVESLITDEVLELQKILEYDKFGWKHEYTIDQRGRKQGLHRIYYQSGTLWEENQYKNDLRDGYQKVWNYKGTLFLDKKFEKGNEININH
jgi:hypothetical protein